MSRSVQEQARELALALEWGLVDLAYVAQWADQKILDGEDVDASILSVSLSNDTKSALSGLNSLAKGSPFWPPVMFVVKRILEIDDLSPRHASKLARHLYFLGIRDDAPSIYGSMMHHWDSIDLAIDGVFGTPENATNEFLRDVSALVSSSPPMDNSCSPLT